MRMVSNSLTTHTCSIPFEAHMIQTCAPDHSILFLMTHNQDNKVKINIQGYYQLTYSCTTTIRGQNTILEHATIKKLKINTYMQLIQEFITCQT